MNYKLPLWTSDRLLFFVVLGTSVLSSWLWWVPIRCVMDGPLFEWANEVGRGRLRGAGMDGDFLVLVLMSTLFIATVYMGWRGAQPPFKAILLVWIAVNFASSAILTHDDPAAYRFRGDTMGIDINLAWFMPALKAGLLLMAVWWVVRDFRQPAHREVPVWTPLNTRLIVPVIAIVPLQVVMLRFGPMHELMDKVGWVLTYTEWVLINLAFMPWVAKEGGTAMVSVALGSSSGQRA